MSHVGFWMKHGKYLVLSILYSNLLLNEACKRGWSSILKGSQQGTVAVKENLKEKSLCSFLSWLWRKRRKKCWLCSCSWGLWYIQGAFFNCSSPFSVPKKKLAQPTRIIFHLFNYELEASLVDEAAEDLDLWDWNDLWRWCEILKVILYDDHH